MSPLSGLDLEVCVRKHFGMWGEIENVNVILRLSIAFVRFRYVLREGLLVGVWACLRVCVTKWVGVFIVLENAGMVPPRVFE